MKRIGSIIALIILGTGCQFFLPSGSPPSAGENIANTVKVLPSIMSLEQAQSEMRRRIFMGWVFKHNPAPKVRLIEDMSNTIYQKIARHLFYGMLADDEIKAGSPTDAYLMHQTFAFGVNAYENNENVLVWETLIYPPQPKRDDALIISRQTQHGVSKKPLWRSLPIHIKWNEIEHKSSQLPKPIIDTTYVIIRPVKSQL